MLCYALNAVTQGWDPLAEDQGIDRRAGIDPAFACSQT
jgi:hypothetical protein